MKGPFPYKRGVVLVPTPTGTRPNLKHDFVICNDPDESGQVFIVPFSSVKEGDHQFDDACVVESFEYSHLNRQSYIAYRHGDVTTSEQILEAITDGDYTVRDDLNMQTFLRVRAGISKSGKIPKKLKNKWNEINQ